MFSYQLELSRLKASTDMPLFTPTVALNFKEKN